MRILIIAVGKMKSGPERELVTKYFSRAKATGKNLGFQGFEVIEQSEARKSSANSRQREEAKSILCAIPQGASVIALDENGITQTSKKFARNLEQFKDTGIQCVCFIIGGADGLDETVRQRAETVLSFSPLTWPHQIVRILLAEQLYRSTTILSGHPYHRN